MYQCINHFILGNYGQHPVQENQCPERVGQHRPSLPPSVRGKGLPYHCTSVRNTECGIFWSKHQVVCLLVALHMIKHVKINSNLHCLFYNNIQSTTNRLLRKLMISNGWLQTRVNPCSSSCKQKYIDKHNMQVVPYLNWTSCTKT